MGHGPVVLAVLACLLGSGAGPAPQAAAALPAKARVTEVTVFPDRAEIVRVAALDLPAGLSAVEFTDLPWSLEPDSVRIAAEGVAAVLGAVEIRPEAGEPGETPEQIAAQAEVKRIDRLIAELVAAEGNAAELKKFIASLAASTGSRESERLAEGRADPAA
jgi:hypothetical protein